MRNLWFLLLVGLATGIIGDRRLLVSSQSPPSTTDDLYLEGRTSGDFPMDDEDAEDDGSGSGSGDYAVIDFTKEEELLMKFLNFSRTTVAKEVVPFQPQPTTDSPHIPPTTAAAAADGHVPTTTGETTPNASPDGGNGDDEVLGTGPVFDSSTERPSPSPSPSSTNAPPSETTTAEFSIDISVTKGSDEEDNSLDRLGVPKPTDEGESVLVKVELDNEIRTNVRSRMYDTESPEEVTSENLWERTEVLAAVIACGVVGFLCAVSLLLLLAYRMKKKDEGSYDLGDNKLSPTAYHKAPTKEFYA